jgi:hypothetical protein
MSARREQRVEVNLPVRVWGLDGNGNPFVQSARTIDVTRNGARLRDLFCLAKAGEIIRIQHGLRKANFRVQWIGHPGTGAAGQVGIHCLDTDKYIWGVPLPKTPPAAREHRVAAAAAASNHSHTGFASEAAKPASIETPPEEMRGHARYACHGTAEVGPEGGSIPIWCGLSDISLSGCYAETPTPLPPNTSVYIRLRIFGMKVHALGVVRTSHAGVGMGISFAELSDEDQRWLHCILKAMAAKAENGRPAVAPNPNSVFLSPQPSSALLHDRSLLAFHNRHPHENGSKKAPPSVDPEIATRLEQLSKELESLPQTLSAGTVDARILPEFKNAADHARHTLAAVQQWIELQSLNRDPFSVIHKLNQERVRAAAGLNHRLTMDLDAAEIDFDTPGLNELYESTRDLYSRLQRLFKKGEPV